MSPSRGTSSRGRGTSAGANAGGRTTVRDEAERLHALEAAQRERPELVAGRGRDTSERTLGEPDDRADGAAPASTRKSAGASRGRSAKRGTRS